MPERFYFVMRGLDPRIHDEVPHRRTYRMDCRVILGSSPRTGAPAMTRQGTKSRISSERYHGGVRFFPDYPFSRGAGT
jgi:hypothetical protein